jgi:ATP-dependent helicase Lhr and Lhr-like helicase
VGGIDRLHPHLQHAIVHDLGWRSLRPVQALTIDAVLDGANAIVLAPTAGGKTEASMFPVLSRILAEEPPPVAALYICPIRALLNNQEDRIGSYCRMVGLSAFKWHGDVSDARKSAFRASPSHVLMTTPESLEVMMISERTDVRRLLSGLQAVIIDEVHAFAGDDRGAHLAALLERIVQTVGRDFQRIGLSATVGNPRVIGQWMQGSSQRPARLIDPPRPAPERDVTIDSFGEVEDAAAAAAKLGRGKKSLVFVESRSRAESVAHAMAGSGVEVFIHHSAVSRDERELAEQQFASGQNTAIVCTATMELGIDVGDLDHVMQVDAPATVASFLQRMGRTGRRTGRRANTAFLCTSAEALLQAAALARLADRSWVEDVQPVEHAVHVLAHQVMALGLQEGGVSRHKVLGWIQDAYPFTGIDEEQLNGLLATMLSRQILYESDGFLSLGAKGEQLYGRKNFFELYAVFSSPPVFRVVHGRDEIGYIQARFIQGHDEQKGPLCFRLAGRAWQVVEIVWQRGLMMVRPADAGRVPNWLGPPSVLSYEICQAIRETLASTDLPGAMMTPAAEADLRAVREGYADLLALAAAPLESTMDGIVWHTFAGGAINRVLAAGLEHATHKSWVAGNLSIRSTEAGLADANAALAQLPDLTWEPLVFTKARSMARGVVSKFQPCLPAEAEDRLLAEKFLDLAGALRFVVQMQYAAREGAAGLRLGDGAVDVLPELAPEIVLAPVAGAFQPRNPISWVDSVAGLERLVELLAAEDVIALDVETALDFSSLCLLQIGTRTRTWIIDALRVRDLGALSGVLGDRRIIKVIHNAKFERRILAKEGLEIAAVFDTLEASRRNHGRDALGGHSLAAVVERELKVYINKGEQTSNWTRRPLSSEQLAYAAADVEVLIELDARMRTALPLFGPGL